MAKHIFKFHNMLLFCAVLLALYIGASVLNLKLLSNIFSGLSSAIASGILAYSYSKSERTNPANLALAAFSSACIVWTIADILWALYSLLGLDPQISVTITVIYFLTNVFLMTAALIFVINKFNKWNSFNLLLDTLAIGSSTLFLIWILFFDKTDDWLFMLTKDGFISAASIILDIIMITGLLLYMFSLRKSKIPSYIYIFICGLLLYTIADLYYYYIYSKGVYLANSYTDYVYSASLLVLALGGVKISKVGRTAVVIKDLLNTELKSKWPYLLVFPLAGILLKGFDASDTIVFAIIIIMYEALSVHVQLSVKNAELLQKEMEINLILEKRVEQQMSELNFLTNYDTVTNLYNRRFFSDSLKESMDTLVSDELLALFLIDIDRFKTINDIFGHDIGDKVLVEISSRMLDLDKEAAILARLGGDEFAFLYKGSHSREDLINISERLIEACGAPVTVGRNTLYITISVGISIYPADATDSINLMKNADIAMYRAKSNGYNKYVFFDPFFNESIGKKSKLEFMLRKASIEKDFELFYQPQFSLPDKKLIGAEALISWKSKEFGYILPEDFIPIAEEIDYIVRIGKWVLLRAADQVSKWNKQNSSALKMSINISPKQLNDEDFMNTIKSLFSGNGLDSKWIDVEITENIMLEDDAVLASAFNVLKELCISVSIDDFGSGYSSWGYLNKYPFNRIKIDKSIVDILSPDNLNGIQVVKAIIAMANAIGIETIAEGVEKQEQLDILIELGCPQVQGFLLGRPVPASVFEKLFIEKTLE